MSEGEVCADCGRPIWSGDSPPDEKSCVRATEAFAMYDDDLLCAELTIARLRSELAALREMGEAERAVVDAQVRCFASAMNNSWQSDPGGALFYAQRERSEATIALIALRSKGGA